MPEISQIIDVTINAPRAGISRAGFGTPIIVGTHLVFNGQTRTYTTKDALLADFPITTPEGVAATAIFAQSPQVRRVMVGRRQVDAAVVTVESAAIGSVHRLTVQGTAVRKGVAKIIFDADLVTSNTINGEVNGIAIDEITFATSHAVTMQLIADEIELKLLGLGISSVATVGGASNRTITVVAENAGVTPSDWVVAAGASQAGVTHTLTEANVATELRSAINTLSLGATASGSGDDVDLDVDETGTGWTVTLQTSNLSLGALVAVDSLTDDLTAIKQASNDWYAMILTDRTPAAAIEAAAWISAYEKLLFVSSQQSAIVDDDAVTDTTSLIALLKAAGYENTIVWWHADADDEFPEAALAGKVLPFTPGSYTAFMKELVFASGPSTLTDTQSLNARSKNANLLETFDVPRVWNGVTANGTKIDRLHGRHKLFARLRENVFAAIANIAKAPYSDVGVGIVEQAMRSALDESVTDQFLLTGYVLQLPDPREVDPVDRGNRLLPDCNFSAFEAGAIERVEIRGILQV
jgi:hypothetical protein